NQIGFYYLIADYLRRIRWKPPVLFRFLGTFMLFDASLSERSKISAFPSKKYSQPKKVCVILVTLHGD
ncbi:TPA: hypothetical protein ACGHN9_004330, partial [Salmonella enterica subsp. diarizonae serovar 61:z52:z53]